MIYDRIDIGMLVKWTWNGHEMQWRWKYTCVMYLKLLQRNRDSPEIPKIEPEMEPKRSKG